MAAVYNLEPPPTAKVLLQTTSGEILVELFAKQTPLTSRNFIQLCLDGYYNGTMFHRLVPGFIIQGGDPTGTGEGGEAVYDGGLFADEFHSRLKFNRRGLLGMANGGQKDDNGSQFFFTLGKTEELTGKNTMFGRVVGDTLYNLIKMAEVELEDIEGSERPLYPTKITGAEILVNPFEDMVKREPKARALIKEKDTQKKKLKKKGGKALLSFGGEDGDDAEAPVLKKAKFNTKLVTAIPSSVFEEKPKSRKSTQPVRPSRRSPTPVQTPASKPDPKSQLPIPDDEEPSRSPSSSPEPAGLAKVSSLLERTNAQIAEIKASMRRDVPSRPPEEPRKKSALEQMIPANAIRGRKRKHGNKAGGADDAQTLKMLDAFRAKLDQAPPEVARSGSPPQEASQEQFMSKEGDEPVEDDSEEKLCDLHFIINCQSCQSWDRHVGGDEQKEDDDINDMSWMSHALSFEKDRLGKDLNWKRKNEEELLVIDPREKAKDIKEEQKAKRAGKGTSSKAWDRDRDRGKVPERIGSDRR